MTVSAFRAEVALIEGMPHASSMALAGRVTLDEASAVRSEIPGWHCQVLFSTSACHYDDLALRAVLLHAAMSLDDIVQSEDGT